MSAGAAAPALYANPINHCNAMETVDKNCALHTEELHVAGDKLLQKIKHLLHEGNVRRIIVRNDEGHTVLEVPLTLGIIGTVAAPVLAAVGAIAALAAHWRVVIIREQDENVAPTGDPAIPGI